MILVIQCAGSKNPNAGTLRTRTGRPVNFVARPDLAPSDGRFHARPDDVSDQGASWRTILLEYNERALENPHGLLPACELYRPPIYRQLAAAIHHRKLYILSAGWGLLRADFLTPDYDITFSASARGADAYKRRGNRAEFSDFNMLPAETTEPVLFFGGKDYLPLFLKLTGDLRGRRMVFHASAEAPDVPGCLPVRFETTRRTNWHYSCAEAFLAGRLKIPDLRG